MRKIFQVKIENKYGPRYKWKNSPADGAWFFSNERWKEKLSQEMQRSLQRGNCERWDMTLLFHALLHSSHCLLMDKIAGTQADLQKGSRVVKLGGSLIDVRRILHPGDVGVFDLGHTYCRSPVQSVRKAHEFQVSKPFPYDKTLADIYICKSEWQALERLSWRRNDYFAHSQSCEMSSSDLNTLIPDVAQVYLQFQVPAHIIAQMKAIGKGIYYSFEHNLITICMRYITLCLFSASTNCTNLKYSSNRQHQGNDRVWSECKSRDGVIQRRLSRGTLTLRVYLCTLNKNFD